MGINADRMCVLLQVFDMPTSLAFYRDILGFSVIQAVPPGDDCDWCSLKLGATELMLNTQYETPERPTQPDAERSVGHGDVGLFFNCADVEAAYVYLREKGVAVQPPVDRDYGMRQLYFSDPDGYGLCLQAVAVS